MKAKRSAKISMGSTTPVACRAGRITAKMLTESIDTPFFFFQAEDGIRASSVTGVQTCALPISVGWFLDSVALPAASNYAVFGTEGVADDLEVAAILDQADDLAARRVLQLVGLDDEDALSRAQVRAYGGLAKATAREWARRG